MEARIERYEIRRTAERVLVYWHGSFGLVHVGTLDEDGLAMLEQAACRGVAPPPPGDPRRGRWVKGHLSLFLSWFAIELATADARQLGATYTVEERDRILVAFAAWKGTVEAFCASEGVSRSTLHRWRKSAGERRAESGPRFFALDGGRG